jgi:hypothetical protein
MKTRIRRILLPSSTSKRFASTITALLLALLPAASAAAITIDHNSTTLSAIPASAIEAAKAKLKIVYGHTSHGSQLTDGMTGLASWKGSLYAWNDTGADGALHLVDFYGSFGGSGAQDLGNPDYTSWEAATRAYLPKHTDINVVVWSWCGELAWASENDVKTYLSLMSGLERDFPKVTFVYMTCHLDGTGENGNLNQRNEQIRAYCKANNKVLYDFADIESYDPDGKVNYMKLGANDACDYDSNGDGSTDSNWATAWQNSHVKGTDWYDCGSAHSQPLNANRKAYAAWYLWAELAGWKGEVGASAWAGCTPSKNWYNSWYGWFYSDEGYGDWIYSFTQGFQCAAPSAAPDSVFLWDDALQDWWWTGKNSFPYIYDFTAGTWLCYVGGNAPEREFWNYKKNARVNEKAL